MVGSHGERDAGGRLERGEDGGEVEKEHSSGQPLHEWRDDSRSAGQEAARRKNGVKGRWVEGGRLTGVMLVF